MSKRFFEGFAPYKLFLAGEGGSPSAEKAARHILDSQWFDGRFRHHCQRLGVQPTEARKSTVRQNALDGLARLLERRHPTSVLSFSASKLIGQLLQRTLQGDLDAIPVLNRMASKRGESERLNLATHFSTPASKRDPVRCHRLALRLAAHEWFFQSALRRLERHGVAEPQNHLWKVKRHAVPFLEKALQNFSGRDPRQKLQGTREAAITAYLQTLD